MKNVLLLLSSPRGEGSLSSQVATELANSVPDSHITIRNLWKNPVPHIGPEFVQAIFTPPDSRTPEQAKALAVSDELIAELTAANIVIIGAGMINFGVPSALKAWIDQVTRSGVTFRVGPAGAEGLLTGKKTILVLATGWSYVQAPMSAMNHLEPPLRTNLGFLGLTDIETVLLDGTIGSPDASANALAAARSKTEAIVASLAA